jgi:hypothetical protein
VSIETVRRYAESLIEPIERLEEKTDQEKDNRRVCMEERPCAEPQNV